MRLQAWGGFVCALMFSCVSHAAPGPERKEYLSSFGDQISAAQVDVNAIKSRDGIPELIKGVDSEFEGKLNEKLLSEGQIGQNDNQLKTEREPSAEEFDLLKSTEAVRLVEKGNYAKAVEILESFLASQASGHQSRKTLATILIAQGESSRAKQQLEKGLSLAPNFSPYKKLMARLFLDTDPGKAVLMLENVPPDLRVDPEYHEIYAVALQMSEQFRASSLVYEALLQLDDRNGSWWMGLALSRDAVGDYVEAEAAYAMANHFGQRNMILVQYGESRLKALRGGF